MALWQSISAILAVLLAASLFAQINETVPFSRASLDKKIKNEDDQSKSATSFSNVNDWNLLHHLGGYGPYISRLNNILRKDSPLDKKCHINQVHMMARHSERYPTAVAGKHMLHLFNRTQASAGTLKGSLSFANDWDFLTEYPADDFEQLTKTGFYAGTLSGFKLGVQTRTDYAQLLHNITTMQQRLKFWTSDSNRVIQTAQYFAAGMLGIDWQRYADLEIIPETADQGANTLTPGDTCLKYADNADEFGWDYGSRMADQFKSTYLNATQARLLKENPGFPLSQNEIYVMQEVCAFELMARGQSKWCDVFTHAEWDGFEYTRDVLHYYRSGPGNPYAATMGWLWLNATAHLLHAGPSEGSLFFSFVHDGDILPMLAALDLFPQEPLPTTHIEHDRQWRTSDMVPMGARIVIERMSCVEQECWSNAPMYPNHVYCTEPVDEHFVRIIVNDGVVPLPFCRSGPRDSCPLAEFLTAIESRRETAGTFADVCGLAEDTPQRITFLRQG